jgi:hypothetical protein
LIIVIKPPEPKQISTWGMLRSVVPLYKMDGSDIKWFMSSTYKWDNDSKCGQYSLRDSHLFIVL